MEPKTRWRWILFLLMVSACADGVQVPDEHDLDNMSPLDRKGVLKNQAGVAKQNIAEKELGGKEDNRHKASKRRLLLDLEAANTGKRLDADPVIQTMLHLKTKEAERKREESLKKQRQSKRSRKNNKKLQDRLMVEMEQTMKRMEAYPKFAKLLRQKEQGRKKLGKIGKPKKRSGSRGNSNNGGNRGKRSADEPVSEDMKTYPLPSEHSNAHKRTKRFATTSASSLWPGAIVPYYFDSGYDNSYADYKNEVLMAMQLYEDKTPVTFTPNDSALAGSLGHSNKLHFISDQPYTCWSYVGYQNYFDQYISVLKCGIVAAIHEVGHAIGLEHEHQHPWRSQLEKIYWQNINSNTPGILNNYYERGLTDTEGNVIRSIFGRQTDSTSYMHYQLNIQDPNWSNNFLPQIGVYDPDIADKQRWSHYDVYAHYTLKDINEYYKPEADPCASHGLTCLNDGFGTKLRKLECKCICAQGFSSESNCTTLEQDDILLKASAWPTATALLQPLAGCPSGFHGDASVMIKSGTYPTPSSWIGEMARYEGGHWELQFDFCVQDGVERQNVLPLGKGDYCYLKTGNNCQEGFNEGSLMFHDIAHSASSNGTNFPSGNFSSPETVVMDFCCRNDGYIDTPMKLPTNHSYVLFPFYLKGCQVIEGMQGDMTFITFNNTVDGYDPTGDYPHIYQFINKPMFNLYVCYYKPLSYDGCGGIFNLNDSNPVQNILTPNYPLNYTAHKRCTWIIHSPENTRIVLNFQDFDIRVGPDGQARDYVEIRHNLKGTPGNFYYGDNIYRSWVSYGNFIAVYLFSDGPETAKGFNGTARLVTQADLVYTGTGENYDGPRNYTRTFENCISWAEAREANCTQDPFSENDRFDILDGNYCRNPGGIVDFPFCYTHAKNDYCRAELCDVSNLESCSNMWQDCPTSVCTTNDAPKCASTCGICDARLAEVQSFPLACAPPSVTFGSPEPFKSSYPMGDNVTLTCNTTGKQVNLMCSTMGNWLPELQHLCGNGLSCKVDELEYYTDEGLKCLKVLTDTLVTYEEAQENCTQLGGHLVTEKEAVSSASLGYLVLPNSFWLGLSDSAVEGTFQWAYGTVLNREDKWAPGEPYSYTPKWTANNTHYASVTWSKTEDGSACIPWSSITDPEWVPGTIQDQKFPVDGSVTNAGANCRDPSKSGKLWCFTSSNPVNWDYCDLSRQMTSDCDESISDSETLYYGTYYNHYHGSVNNVTGLSCWTWANGYPDSYFEENYETAAEAGNKCRIFAPYGFTVPWCWVYKSSSGWNQENCAVPDYCGGNGYRKTSEYAGTVDVTTYGYRCLRWDYLATLVGFEWLTTNFADYFPDENIAAAENYCRGGPWGQYTKPACYFDHGGYIYSWYCPVTEEEEKQDCVYRDSVTGQWKDAYCDEMHMAVCELPPQTGSPNCSDQNVHCVSHFIDNPAVFIDNKEWADLRCALTSGACSPSDPVTCSDPYADPASLNLDVVRNAPPVKVGDYIEHKCKPLYTLVSGNEKRGCTMAGTWTGATPNCTLTSLVGGWNNDVVIRDRHLLDSRNTVYLANNELHRIEHDGYVTGWRLYTLAPGTLELFVFRQNGQVNSFTVIGKTTVAPINDTRAKPIDLSPEESFAVQGGDVIGWRFNSDSDGGIPCDKCKLEYTAGGNWYKLSGAGQLDVNSTYDFTDAMDDCRICSIAANVGPLVP